jgi:hypothetical protein
MADRKWVTSGIDAAVEKDDDADDYSRPATQEILAEGGG